MKLDLPSIISDSIALIASDNLLSCEAEDVAAMVAVACNTWLEADMAAQITQVEQRFQKNLPGSFWTIYGTPDGMQTVGGGKSMLWDWKTVTTIDKDTKKRYEVGWQKKIYLWATGADLFQYRLIQRPEAFSPTSGIRVHEMDYEVTDRPTLNKSVEYYLTQTCGAINAQYVTGATTWAMRAPASCGAYGRNCPRIDTCPAHGGTPPFVYASQLGIVNNPLHLWLNNSGAELFWQCPERYRQSLIIRNNQREQGVEDVDLDDGEGSDKTRFGTSFHAAMARIYTQVQKWQDAQSEAA